MGAAPFQTFEITLGQYWGAMWNSDRGDHYISFQAPGDAAPFLPLGGLAYNGTSWPAPDMLRPLLYMPSPDVPDSLAHPVDYTWILDDAGSGNEYDINYWWPVAPPNYVAMGVVFRPGDTPVLTDYWCVHERYVVQTTAHEYWSDSGQGWRHHNGDLLIADMPNPAPPNAVHPQTLLSAEAMGNGMGVPYVLSWS